MISSAIYECVIDQWFLITYQSCPPTRDSLSTENIRIFVFFACVEIPPHYYLQILQDWEFGAIKLRQMCFNILLFLYEM